VTGETALRKIVEILEDINPDDRYCPLCRPLLYFLKPFVDDPPQPGGSNENIVKGLD